MPDLEQEPEEGYPELPDDLVRHLEGSKGKVTPHLLYRVLCGVRAGLSLSASMAEQRMVPSTFWSYADRFPGLRDALLSAQQVGTHALAQQCLDIADEVEEDRDAVAKAKLRVDTRTYLMRMWHRQYYGDDGAQAQTHTYVINADLGGNVAPRESFLDGGRGAGGGVADVADVDHSGVERIGEGGGREPSSRADSDGGRAARGSDPELGAMEGES